VTDRLNKMASTQLDAFLSADLAPAFWTPDLQVEESRWWPQVPFAFWLVAAARPRSLVELGVHRGVSYAAFCEAARRIGLDARFHAVDTWLGDDETGPYGDEVYKAFKAFHDRRYDSFSTLHRASFENALAGFEDGSIDLLHIDGAHSYAAARETFDAWRGKLSPRGIILLHGARLATDDFGVARLFAELGANAPHFEFTHGDGLGVIVAGSEAPDAVTALCELGAGADAATLRERFEFLGARWSERAMAFSLMQQFEADLIMFRPPDQHIRLPIHKRFARSLQKTMNDPTRHFKKRKPLA
jgi:O-antigen biosynthesis protein